jgi:acid phosphatase (class A)
MVGEQYYGSERWLQAAIDAEYNVPFVACHFNCQTGVNVTPEETPHIYALLLRVRATVGAAGQTAKNLYQRTRPFAQGQAEIFGANTDKSCRSDMEPELATDGSYPSGHSALGWSFGLVFAKLDPANADLIMRRALQYTESRVICNHHWYSDTVAGRDVAAAVFSQLEQNPQFQVDFAAAQTEFAAAKAEGQPYQKTVNLVPDSGATASGIEALNALIAEVQNWNCEKELKILEQEANLLQAEDR